MTKFTVINNAYEVIRVEESYSEAEDRIDSALVEFSDLDDDDLEIVEGEYESYEDATSEGQTQTVESDGGVVETGKSPEPTDAGGPTPQVVEDPEETFTTEEERIEEAEHQRALAELGDSIMDDPLDVLPSYMITRVDEEPTLNKRGVSVLAFHFDVSVVDYEVIAQPHETEYQYCSFRFTVERDGREYVGHGEAHADEVDKSKLLRMAETRAYKRAVIFATGTGIVGYQEVMAELEQ